MAVRFGVFNVNAMLRRLTAKQLLEWEAYASLEPFDEVRADWRAAQVAAMVFNMAVAPKDRKNVSEFLLKFDAVAEEAPKRTQTLEQQRQMLSILAALHATDVKH